MTQQATAAPTQDVVVYGTRMPLTERARARWDTDSLKLLAASKAKGADVAMLFTLAELSARYDLDPWANEIWVASMGGRDGGAGSLAIMVGRDGYMKVAKRDRTFVTCWGQPVYSNDDYRPVYKGTEEGWDVVHAPAHPKDRGEPTGAYALLVREGKPTLHFFAPLAQFKRGGGAWKYEDAMIVKCAQSYLLRTTYNVSGPAPADELMAGFDAGVVEGSAVETPNERVELPEQIAGLFARAEDRDPLSWRRNEIEARVFAGDGAVLLDEVRRVRVELEEWLEKHAPTTADEPPAPEEPVDADVVDDAEIDPHGGARTTPHDTTIADSQGVPVPPPVADAQAGDWYQDAAAKAAARYREDVGFKQQVDELLLRLNDLEVGLEDAEGRQRDELSDEADMVEETLEGLGVPRGWRPPGPDEQGSIEF